MHTERALTASTAQADAAALPDTRVREFLDQLRETGIELGADQAAAVRGVLTSGARVESVIGPAGTGKSFVVGTLAKAWQDPGLWDDAAPHVYGLASSQIATEVLADEGLAARNVARWLTTQQRLAEDRATEDDAAWHLKEGDLVVVDESAMTDTADLAAVHRHVAEAGAKLLLVGDHRQLAAVGAGGAMELVADAGASYELADARRFTQLWEREASLRLRSGDESVLTEYHKHGRLLDGGALEQTEESAVRAWLGDTLAGQHSLLVVDTNDQAARLSAELRAQLVKLGRVAEHGVPLNRQGTYAGVGDLVQARSNGWNLTGYDGNRRGPINREQYRVLETGDDGRLIVAPIVGRTTDGEQLGDRMTLPADYVAEHVTLGYAGTVHAAQGLTVDTSHIVVTPKSGPEALYVGMSRGRGGNTAHVTTLAVPDDAPPGTVAEAVHRDPAAVLANTLEGADPTRSALATATESAEEMESVRTPAELLADAVELATAGRTARWLDELVDAGALRLDERARIAAEDGGPTLARILRRAELAGHDPREVLTDAVGDRSLAGARQITNVLYHRITTGYGLEPAGDTYTERVPHVDDPEWRRYLHGLAESADDRRRELGDQLAADPPQWAVEALGPVPEDLAEATEWSRRAGAVAAHRELTGYDDAAEPLGSAPKPGQVETYASWLTAWRALGRPEAHRDELEMSDGQLRVRIRAAERENTWAPRYVADELAGTVQAAETHRHTATLRAAEAENTADEDVRAELQRQAAEAAELANTLDQRVEKLRRVDHARGQWLIHTAATRAAADRAQAELAARHADDEPTAEEAVTAEEWLAAHQAATEAEDPHREITSEHDLADVQRQRTEDLATVPPELDAERDFLADTEHADVRKLAAEEPAAEADESVRVPSADETAESVRRAQRALAEIAERTAADQAREVEEARAAQLARWHADDLAAEEQAAERERDDALEFNTAGAW